MTQDAPQPIVPEVVPRPMTPEELLALFRPLVGLVQDQVASQTVLNYARASEVLGRIGTADVNYNVALRDACLRQAAIILAKMATP